MVSNSSYAVYVKCAACDSHMSSPSGVIASPRYPRPYPPSLDCTYVVTLSLDKQVFLSVDLFDLEWSNNCTKDWLEIRNGGHVDSPLVGKYCGQSPSLARAQIRSFTNQLLLRFHSDQLYAGKGFQFRYFADFSIVFL